MINEPEQTASVSRRCFLGGATGAMAICGAAPVREEPEEIVSLKNLVTTSGQEGLAEFPWSQVRKGNDYAHLTDDKKIGPSNLFLVVGKDFDVALDATCAAFLKGAPVTQPVIRPGDKSSKSDRLWAVFYFGAAQSSPSEWFVTQAAVRRGRVRVTCRRPDPSKRWRLFDRRIYMFWIPLGERNESSFTLESYDETNKTLMMTRCVMPNRTDE